MIRFGSPEYAPLFLLLLPLAGLYVWSWLHSRAALRRVASEALHPILMPERSRVRPWIRLVLMLGATAFLILALMNPLVGSRYEKVRLTGVDLMVALDVSASMNAQDILPSRIVTAKKELAALIQRLTGDRIGLIVFAGESYTQVPLTTDYNAALLLADIVTVGSAPRPGTAIGSAIDLARESFKTSQGKGKALIIISDGENHEDDPVDAAKSAASEGIVTHCIGMGSPEGTGIPLVEDGRQTGMKRDEDGKPVTSRLDEETLKEIAAAGGGTYTRAENGRDNLAVVFERIGKMQKNEYGVKQFTAFESRFQYPLALAVLLLCTEFLLSRRRNPFLSRFAIFRGRDAS